MQTGGPDRWYFAQKTPILDAHFKNGKNGKISVNQWRNGKNGENLTNLEAQKLSQHIQRSYIAEKYGENGRKSKN